MVIFDGMNEGWLKYGNSEIHYKRWGEGANLIIAFPGFGETAESYFPIGDLLHDSHSLIAIDLPFHGLTTWHEGAIVELSDLQLVIDLILAECALSNARYCLMGFSMGGRIALSLYEAQPERAYQLLLIAPDGLVLHFLYWLSTQTNFGNSIFKWTMDHPGPFLKIADFTRKVRLVSERRLRFTKHYLEHDAARRQLYQIWTGFRRLKPNLRKITAQLNHFHTPLTLIFGKHDPLIKASQAGQLKQKLGPTVHTEVLEGGHRLLNEKHAPAICSFLLTGNQVNLKQ